jgi:hypothetical protein
MAGGGKIYTLLVVLLRLLSWAYWDNTLTICTCDHPAFPKYGIVTPKSAAIDFLLVSNDVEVPAPCYRISQRAPQFTNYYGASDKDKRERELHRILIRERQKN